VAESGSRGDAYPKNQRDRDKAEVFELARARVSRQVEVMANGAAAELRAERLQAVPAAKSTPGPTSAPAPDHVEDKSTVRSRAIKTTGGLKRDASTRAMGARRQAKRTVAETVPAAAWQPSGATEKSRAARERADRAREMLRNALAEQAEADAGS
jgi:hypothetical protein